MRFLAKIECWEAESVYNHMRVASLLVRSSHRNQRAQVAIRTKMEPVWLEVHPCLCASSMSVDILQCQFGKEGSCLCDFRE
jgi:diaminopimelate epimerase